jgi:hypothetical protein
MQDSANLNLKGYPNGTALWICWNNNSGGEKPSVEAQYVYGTKGSYATDVYAYNAVSSTHLENAFSTSTANFGYANCFSMTGRTNPVLARLKAYYADTTAYVLTVNNALLPKQGVRISAIGTTGTESKKVTVLKTTAVVPAQFDYVLYQKSSTDNLSN